MKSRAILLVGHGHWGKSKTLKALTGDLSRSFIIAGFKILIRRMSNDDKPDELKEYVKKLNSISDPFVIIAFCPKKEDFDILKILRKKYQIHPFILKHRFSNNDIITDHEIGLMEEFGPVLIYEGRGEAEERARALLRFLREIL